MFARLRASVRYDTPFGPPSDVLVHGRLGEVDLVFLPRHGIGHRLTPTEVPYRANVHAMKQALTWEKRMRRFDESMIKPNH